MASVSIETSQNVVEIPECIPNCGDCPGSYYWQRLGITLICKCQCAHKNQGEKKVAAPAMESQALFPWATKTVINFGKS